ncbi:MAG: hypothetical protein A2Z16_01825 [Chloroflexi bacterium RBG_16_54_18]|nr:MAG: hypothetical protein A2Z16_01825 [Chloroflexi bacterium RBG_16_54_18]
MELFLGFLVAAVVGATAWKAGALSRSGAAAAAVTGGLIFGLGSLAWAALLLVFFISSSLLSRMFGSRKAALTEKFSKGSRRDWAQVTANGGLGALLALAWAIGDHPTWAWAAFAGAMAAVNADTWATELGVLNPAPPRLITTFKPVERGASGGVSPLGSLAAVGGAGLIAFIALVFTPGGMDSFQTALPILVVITVAGACGALFDSLLGATVQAIYFCPTCNKETERHPLHTCGTPTVLRRGWRWLNNDVVNFFASLIGALAAVGLLW